MSIDLGAVFAKSAAGWEQIQKHSRSLPLQHRQLLMLMDGKRSIAELLRHHAAIGSIPVLAEELLELGLIERPGPGTRQSGGGREAGPATITGHDYPLLERPVDAGMRTFLEDETIELIGPMGAILCEDACRNASTLRAALEHLLAELEPADQKTLRARVASRLARRG